MSHKLTSDTAVIYNAQTQASSVLTITPQQTSFNDNEGYGPMGGNSHMVSINATVWSNYGLNTQNQVDRVSISLTDIQWDAFVGTANITSTGSYDTVVEAALLYVKDNHGSMYGLTSGSWIYSV
jgi:hypothetical protein